MERSGPTRAPEGSLAPPLGRAGHPPGYPVAPLGAPFGLYLATTDETPKIVYYSQTPLCTASAAVSRSGLPGEAAPAPCQKEEPPPGDHPSPWTPPGCAVSSPPWTMGP